jgi:NhaA family Na+:H+ antiporter
MSEDRQANTETIQLPKEIVDRLTKPFAWFLRIEAAGGAILLLFAVAALVLSNSPWAHPFERARETPIGLQLGSLEFARSLREWINDGLMTLFFFLVAFELKRELVLGELNNPRMASLSIAAALGGMLVPAALYLMLQSGQPGPWLGHSHGNRHRVCHRLPDASGIAYSAKPARVHAFAGNR